MNKRIGLIKVFARKVCGNPVAGGLARRLPGQTREVVLEIPQSALGFMDRDLRHVVEPGWFDVMVGLDSQALEKASFQVSTCAGCITVRRTCPTLARHWGR